MTYGMASVVTSMEDGGTAEFGIVGLEGGLPNEFAKGTSALYFGTFLHKHHAFTSQVDKPILEDSLPKPL